MLRPVLSGVDKFAWVGVALTPTTPSPTPWRAAVNQVKNGSTCEAARRTRIMSRREARIRKPPRGVTRDWVPLRLQRGWAKTKINQTECDVSSFLNCFPRPTPAECWSAGVLVCCCQKAQFRIASCSTASPHNRTCNVRPSQGLCLHAHACSCHHDSPHEAPRLSSSSKTK